MPSLNPRQLEAVHHGGGPLLILAGAGTGKTRVVTERMAHLIRCDVRPENILGVTFTNKAAAEMRSRLAKLVGRTVQLTDMVISTFHSLAVRLIRRDASVLGYTPGFSICDRGEQSGLIRKAATTVRGLASLSPDDLLDRIGSLKTRGLTPDDFSRQAIDDDEQALAAVYRRYQAALKRQDCLDFDDLLLQAATLLARSPGSLEYWRERFRHIMVDEFQDANAQQFALVRLLAAPRDNLCVVGDDDQSIYAWRGAMAGNILRFHEKYPAAVTVTLEQNYRSTSVILSAANAVIKNNSGRREKNLWSDLGGGKAISVIPYNDQFEEAAGIVQSIAARLRSGGPAKPGDFAVIIRANAQSRPLEEEFLAAKIPYEVIGGQNVFDRKEARDVMAFLSLIANPLADGQLLRVINIPPRGIGDKTVEALAAHALRQSRPVVVVLADAGDAPGMSSKSAEACAAFARQIAGWRERLERDGLSGLVTAILTETNYIEEMKTLYHDPIEIASRWNDAREMEETLAAFAAANPGPPMETLTEFLREAQLAGPREGKKKAGIDAVRIITAHSAKGLEYPFVFIPGLEEEVFPHKNALEIDAVDEERRLFYVAMTRARTELTLTYCRARVQRGKDKKRAPSRFLAEIPDELLDAAHTPTRRDETLEWVAGVRGRLGGETGAGEGN